MSDDMKPQNDDIHPLAKLFMWTQNPKVKAGAFWAFAAGLVLTAALMVPYPNKHPAPWEVGPVKLVAYGVIGGFAYCVIVLATKPFMALLSRPEDFYAEGDDHDV